MIILPLTYLGSVGWFERLLSEECLIDLGEHYVKQTERNRTRVLTAAGVATLTAPVIAGGSKTKKRMREVRLDHSQRWEARHWQTLRSAYGNSPYFEHYADRFEAMYRRKFEFLVDFNLELLDIATTILHCRERVHLSESYITPNDNDLDLRSAEITTINAAPYIQVFSDRFSFEENLSVVDAIFNEGRIQIVDIK